jgi:hypothetical protein
VEFNQEKPDFTLDLQASAPWYHAGVQADTCAGNNINNIPFGSWFSGPINSADAFMDNITNEYGQGYGTVLGWYAAHEFGHWALQLVHNYAQPSQEEQGIMSQGDLSQLSPSDATFITSQVPRLKSLCNQLHPPPQQGGANGGPCGTGGCGSYWWSMLEQWWWLTGGGRRQVSEKQTPPFEITFAPPSN